MLILKKKLYFNSIKVRLESIASPFRPNLAENFNSIKVRLEFKTFKKMQDNEEYFNSIKVRLE